MEFTEDVRLAQSGNKDSFVKLIKNYEKYFYVVFKSILDKDEDCADAIQETILDCYRNMSSLKQLECFKAWFTSCLINNCYKILKHNKKFFYLMKLDITLMLKMTLKEVCCDDNKLFAGYVLQGDIKFDIKKVWPTFITTHTNKINGGNFIGSDVPKFKKIDNNTYLMNVYIDLKDFKSIPKKFRFTPYFSFGLANDPNNKSCKFDLIVCQKDFIKKCKNTKINKKEFVISYKYNKKNRSNICRPK